MLNRLLFAKIKCGPGRWKCPFFSTVVSRRRCRSRSAVISADRRVAALLIPINNNKRCPNVRSFFPGEAWGSKRNIRARYCARKRGTGKGWTTSESPRRVQSASATAADPIPAVMDYRSRTPYSTPSTVTCLPYARSVWSQTSGPTVVVNSKRGRASSVYSWFVPKVQLTRPACDLENFAKTEPRISK